MNKEIFYKTLNNIVSKERLTNEETYIINDYISELELEIERLNNIIKTQMYCKYANNCDEIYDCTKEEYNTMCEKNMEMSLEITRLNNIINELEKWLEEKQMITGINNQGFSWGVAGDCLDKLKELKGKEV